MSNSTSESPTHPDAPRAGGETPDALTALAERADYTIERLRAVSESVNAGHDRYIPNDADDAADLIAEMRAALLARHRDGERDTKRLDWLEHCNSQKRGDVPILPPSCGYSVRQYIDRQLADANTPCAAPPSPERAST